MSIETNLEPHEQDTAVVYMSHRTTFDAMNRFATIVEQAGSSVVPYLLLDKRAPGIVEGWADFVTERNLARVNILHFDIDAVAQNLGIALMSAGSMVPGCCHFPLMWLGSVASHNHYWLIEDDVLFTGDWGKLFCRGQDVSADLICCHLTTFNELPNWYWWPSLHVPVHAIHAKPPSSFVLKGYLPLCRISSIALQRVLAGHREGWSGHSEALVPSILRYFGLQILDINALSNEPLYTSGAIMNGEGPSMLSTMRWRPPIETNEIQAATAPLLFHPVK